MVQVHQIQFRLKKSKRIGRGGKRGNYSGRGIKGQKARAGHKIKPMIREMILRFPKLRGSGNVSIKKPEIFEVNLDQIDKVFQAGEKVDQETILAKGLVKVPKTLKRFIIKILGRGKLTKKLVFDHRLNFSERAKQKILAQGSVIQ